MFLKFYLSWHDFSVGSANVDASVKSGPVVSLDNIATKDFAGADTAVIWALGSGEAILGPAKGMQIVVEQSVLLLDAEPRLVLAGQLHGFQAGSAVVGLARFLVVLVGVAENESVVAQVKGIPVDSHRIEVDVRVAALGLVSRAAVIVPNRQFCAQNKMNH